MAGGHQPGETILFSKRRLLLFSGQVTGGQQHFVSRCHSRTPLKQHARTPSYPSCCVKHVRSPRFPSGAAKPRCLLWLRESSISKSCSHSQPKESRVIRCGVAAANVLMPRQACCAVPVTPLLTLRCAPLRPLFVRGQHTKAQATAAGGLLHFVRPRAPLPPFAYYSASAPLWPSVWPPRALPRLRCGHVAFFCLRCASAIVGIGRDSRRGHRQGHGAEGAPVTPVSSRL
jgi:hypothetical protein